MRSALVDNELSVRYELLRSVAGLVDGDDLVPFAVNDQCRLIELRKVAAKVGFRERLHRIVGVLETALHTMQPPELDHRWLHKSAGLVEPITGEDRKSVE